MTNNDSHPFRSWFSRALASGKSAAQSFEAALTALRAFEETVSDGKVVGSQSWEQFLLWCLDTTGGKAALVVDDQGLTVGAQGDMKPELVEVLAARVASAFEQSKRICARHERLESVTARFRGKYLSMLPIRLTGLAPVVVAVLGRRPIEPDFRVEEVFKTADYDRLLSWAAHGGFEAESSFIVDSGGLVISTFGEIESDDATAFGTHLSVVLNQLTDRAIGGKPEFLAVKAGSRWVSGFTIPMTKERTVTVGFVSDLPPDADFIRRARKVFKQRMLS